MGKKLLGMGVVTVGGVAIGLTRGGSVFDVEREVRHIEADGDRGIVKGRSVIDKEQAKLTVNALEPFEPAEITKYFAGTSLATGANEVLTSTLTIVAGNYYEVVWTGYDDAGRQVVIRLANAINFESINLVLEDKNEVVPSLVFTATYDPSTRNTAPWSMEFVSGTTRTVTFTVTASAVAVANASVYFYYQTVLTNASGVAAFTYIPEGINRPFAVTRGGYQTYNGAVTVDGAEAVAVSLTAI